MNTRLRAPRTRQGFTLLELIIGLALLGSFFGSLLLVVSRGSSTARSGMEHQSLEALARRTLDRLARELAAAGAGTLTPDPTVPWGSDHVTFQRVAGYSAGEVQWETPAEFALELDDGELDDGADNDGDDLVDERQLTYTRDPDGAAERIVLVHGVRELAEGELANGADDDGNGLRDEAGLSFRRVGGVLTVRLSLEEADVRGQTAVRTLETSIRLRN